MARRSMEELLAHIHANYPNLPRSQKQLGTFDTARNIDGTMSFGSGIHPSWYDSIQYGRIIPRDSTMGRAGRTKYNPAVISRPRESATSEDFHSLYITAPEQHQHINDYNRSTSGQETSSTYQPQERPAPKAPSTLENLLEQAKNLYGQNKTRLSNLPYAPYRGNTDVRMSPLIAKKREIEREYFNKPTAYFEKIRTLINKPGANIDDAGIDRLVNSLNARGMQGGQKYIDMIKGQEGGRNYNPEIENAFKQNIQGDFNRNAGLYKNELNDLNFDIKQRDLDFNKNFIKTLNTLSENKKIRRNEYTKRLGHLGNQEHAYAHLLNEKDLEKFNREKNIPFEKLEMLNQIINSINPNQDNPQAEIANESVLRKAMEAYNTPYAAYQGQRVANLPNEILESRQKLLNTDFKNRDALHQDRKNIRNELLNRSSAGQRAVGELNRELAPINTYLDHEGEKMLKRAIAEITSKHIQYGTRGSSGHMGEINRITQEIMKKRHNEAQKIQRQALEKLVGKKEKEDINQLSRLEMLDALSNRDFANRLENVENMNHYGAQVFANNQSKINRDVANFENQANWEWPQLRNTGSTQVELVPGAAKQKSKPVDVRAISLNKLIKELPVNFVEV